MTIAVRVTIYVSLPDEVVDVWRPIAAEHLAGQRYRIVEQPYDRSIERWQFEPGDQVICVRTATNTGEVLRAIERAT